MAFGIDQFVIEQIEDETGDLVELRYFCDWEHAQAGGASQENSKRNPDSALTYESWGVIELDYDEFCAYCGDLLIIGLQTQSGARSFVKAVRDQARAESHIEDDDAFSIDVRAQFVDGSWDFHSGDPQFDQDHRGGWGYGSIDAESDEADIANVAWELLSEAQHQFNEKQDAREHGII